MADCNKDSIAERLTKMQIFFKIHIYVAILYKKRLKKYYKIGKKASIFLSQRCYNINKKSEMISTKKRPKKHLFLSVIVK